MLSVLGLGLISPAGASTRDHVFFPRAEAPPPLPSPFLRPDDRRIDIRYCPWIQPFDAAAGRLLALARSAATEALSALPPDEAATIPLYLVTPAPRPGLPEEAIAGLARAIGGASRAPSVQRFVGAAGAFAALGQIEELTATRQISAALVVGVDSFASVDALTERLRVPPSPFLLAPPPPSEGAGALLVASAEQASRWGLPSLGELAASRFARGRATDENDEPNDGAAMTGLLRGLPAPLPIRGVFGQGRVDLLRMRAWEWTVARCADRFDSSYFGPCIEVEIGELGAAAGAMNLGLAFAMFRHGVAPAEAAASFVAWAISRDGTSGIALGSAPRARADADDVLQPLGDTARARRVARDRFVPPGLESDAEPEDDEAWIDAESPAAANDVSPPLPELPREIAPVPPVRLDPERAPELALPAFYAGVVAHCAELAAAIARDRLEAPRRRLAEGEARMLCQIDAIVAAGPRALTDLAAWWELRIDDPWRGFAGALGAAAFAGEDALGVVHRVVHLLPAEAEGHAITIAEALALSSHPGLAELALGLFASPHPIARAIGVSLRAGRGELPEGAIEAALGDGADAVVRAAIWACERLPSAQRSGFEQRIRERCRGGSPSVAWTAARVLAIGGECDLLLADLEGALGERLGARAVELFVLGGAPSDWPRLEARIGRLRATRAIVSAVARFGSVAAAAWLIQRLGDEALGDAAAEGLRTMFGAVVAPAQRVDAGAWRGAIAAQGVDAKARWRRGRAWSAAGVAEECASGELSRGEVELRIDELRARLRLPEAIDVSGWRRSADANLAGFLAVARGRG